MGMRSLHNIQKTPIRRVQINKTVGKGKGNIMHAVKVYGGMEF
jgi:hypothetical protein